MKKNIIVPIIFLVIFIVLGFLLYINSPVRKASNDPELVGRPITSLDKARAKGKRASLMANLSMVRSNAEMILDSNQTYESLCEDGILNTSDSSLNEIMNSIIEAQGVSDKFDAGVTCISDDEKYVISVDFNNSIIVDDITSYCVDSAGGSGYGSKYVLDKDSISCLLVGDYI